MPYLIEAERCQLLRFIRCENAHVVLDPLLVDGLVVLPDHLVRLLV